MLTHPNLESGGPDGTSTRPRAGPSGTAPTISISPSSWPSVLGILVGFVAPEFAVKLKPLGTGFVNLIKMMIAPVIFCTIVLGIGSVRRPPRSARSAVSRWATS